jgi:hypothetical protein
MDPGAADGGLSSADGGLSWDAAVSPADAGSLPIDGDAGGGWDAGLPPLDSGAGSGPGWGCGENTEYCECWNVAGLPSGYNLKACSAYPCCISFMKGTIPGCDCYSADYFATNGGSCASQVTTIDGEGYSGAAIVSTCPP